MNKTFSNAALGDERSNADGWREQLRQVATVWPYALTQIADEMTRCEPADLLGLAGALMEFANAFGCSAQAGQALFDVPFGDGDLWTALRLQSLAQEADRLDKVLPKVRCAHPSAVHGTPITPKARLKEMAGGSFCVSFYTPDQLEDCIELLSPDSLLLLDNGAFSAWKAGIALDDGYWARYWTWAHAVIERVDQAVAIIPDVIGGNAAANLKAIDDARFSIDNWEHRLMPVWHLDESIEQLQRIVEMGFRWIGFGSSGQYATVGNASWDRRVDEAFAAIDKVCDELDELHPRVHMLRGLGQLGRYRHPFATADSTNIARNHSTRAKDGEPISAFRARIERHRFPAPARAMWPMSQVDAEAPQVTGVQALLFAA
jgi:hypothetical protein